MAQQIVDVRQVEAHEFTHLLDLESQVWDTQLHWDFSSSLRLISACLREKRLAGYALRIDHQVKGYCFSFRTGEKSLVGDLFVDPTAANMEQTLGLLSFTLKNLIGTPAVRRVEAQLPHFSFEQLEPSFRNCCFAAYPRCFMTLSLADRSPRAAGGGNSASLVAKDGVEETHTSDFVIKPWQRRHDRQAARLLYETYRDHVDAVINDQYRSETGTTNLVENILYYQGCGEYLPNASWVAIHRSTQQLAGLLILTAVRPRSGHIPQIAVAKQFQSRRIGTTLMETAFAELERGGFREVSLTVTSLNQGALRLYERLGFQIFRTFGAFVWDHPGPCSGALTAAPCLVP
jgi:ribosomal protein S18 acetylase RimI-like enzyme